MVINFEGEKSLDQTLHTAHDILIASPALHSALVRDAIHLVL